MPKPIVFYVFIMSIFIFPVYGYDHWNFEGDIGQGWNFEGTPQWHLDCNESHNGSCSMRSGEILPFPGPTSIWRDVQGPVIISFWWKADSIQVCTDPSVMCKGLSLLIDGKTQWICNSSDWKEARFPLTDGLHRVEWLFKPRSDQKGIGWLDDVSLAPFPTATPTPIVTYANHSLSFKIPDGWKVAKDNTEGNYTQVVLSDGTNAIRIDLIKHPGIGILIGDYLEYYASKSELDSYAYNPKDTWKSNYERIPWYQMMPSVNITWNM